MALVVGVAAAVFGVKTDTAREAAAIAELNDRIAEERQRISELKAEWSALDHPARIQELLERHDDVLGLRPITAEQIDAVELIPPRVATPTPATEADAAARPSQAPERGR